MSMADPNLDLEPEDDNGEDDDPQSQQFPKLSRKDIRALERKGKNYDDEKDRADRLEREIVFVQAGVDTTSEEGQTFMRGYAGELTKEAVVAMATKFGLADSATPAAPASPAKPNPELQPGEDALTRERAELGNQAPADGGVSPDPRSEAVKLGQEIISEGGKWEEGVGTAFNSLVTAAHNGDRRVIVEKSRE